MSGLVCNGEGGRGEEGGLTRDSGGNDDDVGAGQSVFQPVILWQVTRNFLPICQSQSITRGNTGGPAQQSRRCVRDR